jgi:hypothetical protein
VWSTEHHDDDGPSAVEIGPVPAKSAFHPSRAAAHVVRTLNGLDEPVHMER